MGARVSGCLPIRQDNPYPKLIFPGARNPAIKSSKDAVAIISKWTLKRWERPRHEIILAQILKATSNLRKLLSSAVYEMDKAIVHDRAEAAAPSSDQGTSVLRNPLTIAGLGVGVFAEHYRRRAKAILRNIEANLVTVKGHLEEAKRCIEQEENFDVPIQMAAKQCEDILELFYGRTSFLYGTDNCLFTSPSLVAFVGIYAGVARFQFDLFPHERRHITMKMRTLKSCVAAYREETVAQRLRYVNEKNFGRGMYLRGIFWPDKFNGMSSRECCPRKFCCDENFQVMSNNYPASLENIYRGYFDEPLKELSKLVNQHYLPRL